MLVSLHFYSLVAVCSNVPFDRVQEVTSKIKHTCFPLYKLEKLIDILLMDMIQSHNLGRGIFNTKLVPKSMFLFRNTSFGGFNSRLKSKISQNSTMHKRIGTFSGRITSVFLSVCLLLNMTFETPRTSEGLIKTCHM